MPLWIDLDDIDRDEEHRCNACDQKITRLGFQCKCCGEWYHSKCAKSPARDICRDCYREGCEEEDN